MNSANIFNDSIDEFFEKRFFFKKKDEWILPSVIEEQSLSWSINSLNCLKSSLNEIKSLLNDKGQDWHEHTSHINKAFYVFDAIKSRIQPEILTQAWCKFYEIVSCYNLISSSLCVRSLHLCEAPGAFVSALNYYLCVNHSSTDWEWMANTLNPYYEGHSIKNVVVDDRLLLPTLKHWYFGEDNTGDITDPDFINNLCNFVQNTGLFDLVTADGSVDCLENPGEQELVVEKLHFSEILIALSCLLPQGCFVLKKFTFFECTTICQLYLLNCVFEKVQVFKPFTSRPSNSEVYVICIGFLGPEVLANILQQFKDIYSTKSTVPVFPLSSIPESFIQQVETCMKYFTDLQIKAINENLMLYHVDDPAVMEKLDNLKIACAEAYIQKYNVFSSEIYDDSKLFYKKKVSSFSYDPHKNMKSLYFSAVGDTFNNIKKSSSMQWYDKLLDVEKRIDACFSSSRKRPFEEIEWQSPWKEVRTRMKMNNFENWIVSGKKVACVQNTKFCDTLLLHLWNRISHDTKVDAQFHVKLESFWYSDDLLETVLKEEDMLLMKNNIMVVSITEQYNENDSFLLQMKQNFDFNVRWYFSKQADLDVNLSSENKIVYINTTIWKNSLHSEGFTKGFLTEIFILSLKTLKKGDTLFLCVQSILTRYMAGLIFLIISLFDKFITILPEDSAPATLGQIWIFKNYQNNQWTNKVLQYLKTIHKLNSLGEKEVLEIIPMVSLCDGSFLAYLKNLNNKHLLQRLKSLISIEKSKVRKSV